MIACEAPHQRFRLVSGLNPRAEFDDAVVKSVPRVRTRAMSHLESSGHAGHAYAAKGPPHRAGHGHGHHHGHVEAQGRAGSAELRECP